MPEISHKIGPGLPEELPWWQRLAQGLLGFPTGSRLGDIAAALAPALLGGLGTVFSRGTQLKNLMKIFGTAERGGLVNLPSQLGSKVAQEGTRGIGPGGIMGSFITSKTKVPLSFWVGQGIDPKTALIFPIGHPGQLLLEHGNVPLQMSPDAQKAYNMALEFLNEIISRNAERGARMVTVQGRTGALLPISAAHEFIRGFGGIAKTAPSIIMKPRRP